MARRWIFTAALAAVLVVAAVFAARAIRDDGTGSDAATRLDTTAPTSAAAAATTAAVPDSTVAPSSTVTPAPTSTSGPPAPVGPPGPCGAEAGPIRAAIDAAVSGAANAEVGACRLAASDPTWAAVNLVARPGTQFAATTVIVRSVTGSWSVVAQGGANAGCGQAPQQVIVDLGQFCAGSGGGGAR